MGAPSWLRACLELALAHHPDCAHCRHDVYRIGRARLCIGCFTAYPIAVALLVLLAVGPVRAPPGLWLALGVAAGSVQFLSTAGWTRTRRSKILVKVCLGLGLGFATFDLMALPMSLAWKAGAFLAASLLASFSIWPKARRMLATCGPCLESWAAKAFPAA